MKVSFIIPTLNEASCLPKLLKVLVKGKAVADEIIVVDGGSDDGTAALARASGVELIISEQKGRSIQMNIGAAKAKGELLFFIHADTLPPAHFRQDILETLEKGFEAGCYRSKYDSNHPLLKVNAFFTRFYKLWCRGGDQGLFITKRLFEKMNGFDESHLIMEDYEFLRRLMQQRDLRIVPRNFLISTRKYKENSYFKILLANFVVFRAFSKGASQQYLIDTYKKWLRLP